MAIKLIKGTAVFPKECSATVVFSLLYSKEEQNTHSNNVYLIGSQAVPFTKELWLNTDVAAVRFYIGGWAEQKPGGETFI